ncbi:DUF2946 family protein [Noviherbaspirillum humi]|uniref:DUF2946 family protein n=1 Tax=Noviherbaspirillum humi TaxID=1688639 RepID=UPI001596106D|nr:DUF2946 family protein [Noviherbaspirillum humi]
MRLPHPLAAWLAAFAVLVAALAPTVSHLLAARIQADQMVAAHGAGHDVRHDHDHDHEAHHAAALDSPAAQEPEPSSSGHELHFEHCPFCLTHAGSFGLAPRLAQRFFNAVAVAVFPVLFYLAPQPLFIWLSAQPRAPPAVFSPR